MVAEDEDDDDANSATGFARRKRPSPSPSSPPQLRYLHRLSDLPHRENQIHIALGVWSYATK